MSAVILTCMNYHKITLCGLKRKLPIVRVSKKTRLAQFSLLGDVELVDKLADVLAKKLIKIEFDCLVAPEVRVLPLVHGVALRLKHKRFVVCRKSVSPYMIEPKILKPLPHFPKHVEQLVVDGRDVGMINGRKVVIIDDVVSTGVTMRMIKKMMDDIGAEVVKLVSVVKQGEQFDNFDDLIYLGELPLFKD